MPCLNLECSSPVPLSIHGDTTMAGTLTPSLLNAKPSYSPAMPSGLGTPVCGGGTWSKNPPCSSYVTSSNVRRHPGPPLSASYMSFSSRSPKRTS